jgi:hypothetical protein
MLPKEITRLAEEQKEREGGDTKDAFKNLIKILDDIINPDGLGDILTALAQKEARGGLSNEDFKNYIVEMAVSEGGEGVRQAAINIASRLSNGPGLDSAKSDYLDGYYRDSLADGSITDAQRIEGWAGMSTYERSMALAKIDGRIDTPKETLGKLGAVSNKSEQIDSVLAQVISGQKAGKKEN